MAQWEDFFMCPTVMVALQNSRGRSGTLHAVRIVLRTSTMITGCATEGASLVGSVTCVTGGVTSHVWMVAVT